MVDSDTRSSFTLFQFQMICIRMTQVYKYLLDNIEKLDISTRQAKWRSRRNKWRKKMNGFVSHEMLKTCLLTFKVQTKCFSMAGWSFICLRCEQKKIISKTIVDALNWLNLEKQLHGVPFRNLIIQHLNYLLSHWVIALRGWTWLLWYLLSMLFLNFFLFFCLSSIFSPRCLWFQLLSFFALSASSHLIPFFPFLFPSSYLPFPISLLHASRFVVVNMLDMTQDQITQRRWQ